jgi:hypothetical protein
MRATYEDLLREARRHAIDAYGPAIDETTDLVVAWQATLTAARHHFRWLGLELSTTDFTVSRPDDGAIGPLLALARSLGAGADLLATQDWSSSAEFVSRRSLVAARSEVAVISALGARAVLAKVTNGALLPDHVSAHLGKHLVEVTAELDSLRGRRPTSLGALGGLSTALPSSAVDHPSSIVYLAARWQSAHQATAAADLLTRDLRSTSAQLRTMCGYAAHLADLLSSSLGRTEDLRALTGALRSGDAAAARVGRAWRTRLSDLNGGSDSPAEPLFVELLSALQSWLRDGDRLRNAEDVVPNDDAVASVKEVIDELLHSAYQVAYCQQAAVSWLIMSGRLFVPRAVVAKLDPEFQVSLRVWLPRRPRPSWVRTTRAACFDDLTAALAESVDHLLAATTIAREMAGTSDQIRPHRPADRSTPRAVERSPWRWHESASLDHVPVTSEERTGLER